MNQDSTKKLNWVNTLFLTLTPVATIILVATHLYQDGFIWQLWLLALVFYILTGMSITGGYHRLFAHRSYQASWPVKLFYLLFGAAAFENSVLKWAADHRIHHQHVDKEEDPYNINEGFFHAHMGWICFKDDSGMKYPKDLLRDPLVMWQHKYYLAIGITVGFILPAILGYFMGSALGGLAIAGFFRIVFVHHCTFFINSLCHKVGRQTYTRENSARDSMIMAFFTYGEGYHNFHHKFQIDYRNGIKWYHFDPTKWAIKSMSWVGLVRKLRVADELEILKAKLAMDELRIKERFFSKIDIKIDVDLKVIENMRAKVEDAQKRLKELNKEYQELKERLPEQGREKVLKIKTDIKMAQVEFQKSYEQWEIYMSSLYQLS